MSEKQYLKYMNVDAEELSLRDHLAIDRTLLANERSFLAYVRTSVTLFIAAISLIKFFDATWIQISGQLMLAATAIIFFRGLLKYKAAQRVMEHLEGIYHQKSSIVSFKLPVGLYKLAHQVVGIFRK